MELLPGEAVQGASATGGPGEALPGGRTMMLLGAAAIRLDAS